MAKDKEHKKEKKEKKEKKVRTSELHSALADPANTSTDIILTPSKKSHEVDEEDLYESRLPAQAAFAKPLAHPKLNKKVLKTIKKGTSPYLGDLINFSLSSEGITAGCEGSRQGSAKRRKGVHPPFFRRGN